MVYVRIELWPGGFRRQARLLGEATIQNLGTGTSGSGEYGYRVWGKGGMDRGPEIRRGVIFGFPRTRLLAWDLLTRALIKAFGTRNQPD